jgi:hypothetical protein
LSELHRTLTARARRAERNANILVVTVLVGTAGLALGWLA